MTAAAGSVRQRPSKAAVQAPARPPPATPRLDRQGQAPAGADGGAGGNGNASAPTSGSAPGAGGGASDNTHTQGSGAAGKIVYQFSAFLELQPANDNFATAALAERAA